MDNFNHRIIGGENATVEEIPWQISLQHMGSHRCGGSIIAPDKILTAAHCIRGTLLRFLGIRANSTFHYRSGIEIGVRRTIEHEMYNIPSILNNDIGLVFLHEALVYGVGIQPIKLPEQGFNVLAGLNASISGWGVTNLEDGELSRYLQIVIVPIVDQELCVSIHEKQIPVTDSMICAGLIGEGGKDSCGGDSGGPLVIDNVLQGVVSWGVGCGYEDYPGVYVRTAVFRDWIDSWDI